MNYYAALQVDPGSSSPKAGRWDYCCSNDRSGTYPIGYCAGWRPLHSESAERLGKATVSMLQRAQEESAPFRHKYHSDGHASADEACACYKEYALDQRLRFTKTSAWFPCEECTVLTQTHAVVAGLPVCWLCPEHQTREIISQKYTVATSFGSY